MTEQSSGPEDVDADLLSRLKSSLETTGLERHLWHASCIAMRNALAHADDPLASARDTGLALELLAKSVIFGRERGALSGAPKRYRDGAIAFLEGRGHPDFWSMADVITVNGPVAVETAFDLLELESPGKSRLDAVFRPRNRALHMAQADHPATLKAIAETMRIGVPLLNSLSLDITDWIDHDPSLGQIAQAVLQSDGSAIGPSAFAKKWRASAEWLALCDRLPADVLRELAADPRVKPDAEDPLLYECPTGGHFAWFELEAERSDVQDDETSIEFEMYLAYLHCPLCGLEADYHELDALGSGHVVERRYRDRDD